MTLSIPEVFYPSIIDTLTIFWLIYHCSLHMSLLLMVMYLKVREWEGWPFMSSFASFSIFFGGLRAVSKKDYFESHSPSRRWKGFAIRGERSALGRGQPLEDRQRHPYKFSRKSQLSPLAAWKCANIITLLTASGSNENLHVMAEKVDCFLLHFLWCLLEETRRITAKQWNLEADAFVLRVFPYRWDFLPPNGARHLWNHLQLLWSRILQKVYYPEAAALLLECAPLAAAAPTNLWVNDRMTNAQCRSFSLSFACHSPDSMSRCAKCVKSRQR